MKISKKAIHIICGIFEAVFLAMAILMIYYVSDVLAIDFFNGYYPTVETQCLFTFDIVLPLSLLAATIVIHVLAVKPPRDETRIEMKREERKQKRIERLQSEIDELKGDGE